MRQTLFRIPLDGPWSLGPLGEVPGFGLGIVLVGWILFGAIWLVRNRRLISSASQLFVPIATWIAIAVAIVLLPQWVERPTDAAIADANRQLAADPHAVDSLVSRVQARFSKRDFAGAVSDLKEALAIDPQSADAMNRLAWIQATCPDAAVRDGAAAVKHAQKACELTANKNPEYLATLAAAQAETGSFAVAVATERQALRRLESASETGSMRDMPRMREQLQTLEQGRPYRDRSAGKSLPVFGFGAMLFLGFIAGAWTAGRRGARVGIAPEMMWDIGIWLFIAGVIGCRVFYCIQYSRDIFYNHYTSGDVLKSFPEMLLAAVNLPDGGLVYYGGIPTALLVAFWICRRRHLNFLLLGDIAIPSLFLGMGFGRIGCFLNGCCYGDRCNLPWGVRFPMGSVPDAALVVRGFVGADQDLPFRLHPTQLYSSLDGFFLFFLTQAYFAYRPRNGAVIALGALTYPLTRFAVESLRGDELGQFNTSLTISQWISILTFVVGLIFTAWLSRQPKLTPSRISTAGS